MVLPLQLSSKVHGEFFIVYMGHGDILEHFKIYLMF